MNAFNRKQFLKSSLILGTSAIVTPIVQKRVFATAPAIITADADASQDSLRRDERGSQRQ
jgi:hypothetical protein